MFGTAGLIVIAESCKELTVKVVEPKILPNVAVIFVVPLATAVAFPWEPNALLIVAVDKADEFHSTVVVIFCVLPSENVPVAENCWTVATPTLGLDGVIEMDTSETEVTFRVADPEIFPYVAVMVVEPDATEVAFPLVPAIVATEVADELHVTDEVMS
jgi:hypothetical protein